METEVPTYQPDVRVPPLPRAAKSAWERRYVKFAVATDALAAVTDLRAAVDDVQIAVDETDLPALQQAARNAQDAATRADDALDDPLWAAVASVPYVGDSAEVARVTVSALATASDGLTPLLDVADVLDPASLYADGRIDVDRLEAAQEPLAQASAAVGKPPSRSPAHRRPRTEPGYPPHLMR